MACRPSLIATTNQTGTVSFWTGVKVVGVVGVSTGRGYWLWDAIGKKFLVFADEIIKTHHMTANAMYIGYGFYCHCKL